MPNRQAVRDHGSLEDAAGANAEHPATYVVARARMGPEAFPTGHSLRRPHDQVAAPLADVLAAYALEPGPPELLLGLGSDGDGRVEMYEALLRQFAGVQEPAPSGAVDAVRK